MTPIPLPVRAYLEADGWLRVEINAHELPAGCLHESTVPKLAVSINGDDPHYLNPHGRFEEEKTA